MNYPILPLKNTVLFPKVIFPITIGREKSVQAIQKAHQADGLVAVFAQTDPETESPTQADLYPIGTLAQVVRLMEMPDGTSTALLKGVERIRLVDINAQEPCLSGLVEKSPFPTLSDEAEKEFLSAVESIRAAHEQVHELLPNMPREHSESIQNIQDSEYLVFLVASGLDLSPAEKQKILGAEDWVDACTETLEHLYKALQSLTLKQEIHSKVNSDLDKQQREFMLHQQLKTIQDELGQNPQQQDIDELTAKAKDKKWSDTVRLRFEKELAKLKRLNPAIPDYAIALNYLELLVELPWGDCSEDNFDLERAEEILDKDHFGLDKIKDRILEYLAVLKLRKDMRSPIICLYGPPGVGKTSLGKSIAKCLGREYVRMSLGGLSDEAELRGHRKTYIGAMAGRVIQSIKKAGTSNPVFVLDEIDKMGISFKGDPSSALLEVLDPEQNPNFYDNYLEVEYDLSKILFIATSNSLQTIQPALLDRMEIIEINGYSIEEKTQIAARHIIPKQLTEHGLTDAHLQLPEPTLVAVARDYTRESGVRSLEREIAKIMRFVARKVASNPDFTQTILPEHLEGILGIKRSMPDVYEDTKQAGVAIGLAWTSVGGEILFIESLISKGKGTMQITGNLGDVMKESASTALSLLKSHQGFLEIAPEKFEETNLHIHIPAGAIPKDGPSAGIALCTALASVYTGRPLRPYLAMTGEITLRGKVLPVGGIKEKVLAAKRAGIREIVLCSDNRQDVLEINPAYIAGVQFHYVDTILQVWELALSEKG